MLQLVRSPWMWLYLIDLGLGSNYYSGVGIQGMHGLHLGQVIEYPDWGLLWVLSVLPKEWKAGTLIWATVASGVIKCHAEKMGRTYWIQVVFDCVNFEHMYYPMCSASVP